VRKAILARSLILVFAHAGTAHAQCLPTIEVHPSTGTSLVKSMQSTAEGLVVGCSLFSPGDFMVQRWDGQGWEPIGQGIIKGPTIKLYVVNAFATLDDAMFLVGHGGAGSPPGPWGAIFRWTGSSWINAMPSWPMPIYAATADADRIVLGSKGAWEFDGAKITAIPGLPEQSGPVYSIAQFGGALVFGGAIDTAGGQPVNNIAALDGTNWSSLGDGVGGAVHAMAEYGGQLIVGGTFASAGGMPASNIAAWNGSAWTSLGAGVAAPANLAVTALHVYKGELYVGGNFTEAGGVPTSNLARWDGRAWNAVPGVPATSSILAMEVHQGRLYFGGMQGFVASLGCPCPADCDNSGTLDIDDFVCFQTLFASGSPHADCDDSGVLNIDDFVCFQTQFALGC
jgi:hypothetical protein